MPYVGFCLSGSAIWLNSSVSNYQHPQTCLVIIRMIMGPQA